MKRTERGILLRSTAERDGWHSYYFDRYFGHSPRTTGERHYVEDPDVEVFRRHVLRHIEEEIEAWDAPPDTKVLPWPREVKAEKLAQF